MKPEEVFGVNAGKVWQVLKSKGQLSVSSISKQTGLKTNEVYGALGWLGREGKIQIISNEHGTFYKLIE